MCAASDGTGITHSFDEFLLIRARVLTRQLDFYVQGFPVRNPVSPDVRFAVVADSDDGSVFRVELPNRMVYGVAAVLTEGCNNLVL